MSSHKAPPPPTAFEPEFVQAAIQLFEEKIVFNRHIGLKVTAVLPDRVSGCIDMRDELVGHFGYHRIHGGVIAACLDAMGGLAVLAAIAARHMDESPEQRIQRFMKISTVDLRIDYLRPGLVDHYEVQAEVLRLGSRVASARMAFLGKEGKLLATGAGAYMVA